MFSLKDFLITCLAQWKWFVISIIFFVGVGVFYVVRQQPVYTRTMSLLIQNTENTGVLDVASAFSDLGLGGANTNVYNELISLQSPAVMFEVVKRLDLNVKLYKKQFPYNKTLYGKTAPFKIVPTIEEDKKGLKFKILLQPDGSFTLSHLSYVNISGDRVEEKDKIFKGKIGGAPVKTPVGVLDFQLNPQYEKQRDEDIEILASVSSITSAVESYVPVLKGDLTDADAEVIDLTVNDVNVQRATDILNTVVDVYNEFWVRDKNKVAVATAQFIDDRLNTIVRELEGVDTEIADYQSEHKIPDLPTTMSQLATQTTNMGTELLEITNQLAMARFVNEYINDPANANNVIPMNTGMGNTVMEQMVKEYNTLLLTRNNLAANSGANNPLLNDYNHQLKGLREALIKSAAANVGTLEANLRSIQRAKGLQENQISSTPRQAKYLGAIKRDQTVKESLYLYLLEKREENNLSQAFNAYNTRIITPPYGPSEPIAPRKKVIMFIMFVLGAMLPAVVLYFVVVCDDRVRSRRDMDNLPVPFTGEIPQIGRKNKLKKMLQTKKRRQREIDTPKPIVAEGKRDVPNEAFRVVRSNIDLMLGKESRHSILMVTSFNPGSGKSFIAYNLGASFALKRKKVLLIDGDLRHGSLSTYVGTPHRGLAAYLSENVSDPHSIIYPVEGMNGLSIVPIGKRPPNPAELLEGERFGEFLAAVKDEYDIIMVDCPPVNVVVDTQLLNRYGDATIFVVRAGLLKKSAVRDLTQLYNEKKLKRMSIILNGTEAAHSSYYTYGNYQSLEE